VYWVCCESVAITCLVLCRSLHLYCFAGYWHAVVMLSTTRLLWLHCTDLLRVQWALDNRRARCPFEVVVDNCNVTVVEIEDIARCSCSLAYWTYSSWHLLGLHMLSELLLSLVIVLEGWPLDDELAAWSLDRWLNDGRLLVGHERHCSICLHHSLNLATVGWEFVRVSLVLAVLSLWWD